MCSLGLITRIVLGACCCTLLFNDCYGAVENVESRLIKHLLQKYDADATPTKNKSVPILVHLRLTYMDLLHMNEPKQTITSRFSIEIRWKDDFLHWNTSDYEDTSMIRIDPTRVWKPDLTVFNSVDQDDDNLYSFATKILLMSDGSMQWFGKNILESICGMEMSKFPYDKQVCKIKIGSWTFNGYELELHNMHDKKHVDLDQYNNNSEWDLVQTYVKTNVLKYPCCPHPYYDITYILHFRRKPLYYVMGIIVPCILLSFLSSISFLFPVDSGERISLVTSVLLSLFIFMLIVNAKTPVCSDAVPILTQYFTVISFTIFLSLLGTAFILWMYHPSSSHSVPHYLSKISRFFAIMLCVHGGPPGKVSGKHDLTQVILTSATNLAYLHGSVSLSRERNETSNMLKILNEIQRFSQRLEDDDLKDEIMKEWRFAAKVFDRLFFCISFSFSILLNSYVLSFTV